MAIEKAGALSIIIVLTVLSGFADAQGFLHAAKIWQDGRLVLPELARSAAGFVIGISIYWLALRAMNEQGIIQPEIQTAFWFAITLIGVALTSGSLLRWQRVDQLVALVVIVGIGWLLLRTGG